MKTRPAPDGLVTAALAHPEDPGLSQAALDAATKLGVRDALLAAHPELAK